MLHSRLTAPVAGLLVAVALFVAACGGSSHKSNAQAPSSTSAQTTPAAPSAPAASSSGIPQNNGGDHDADNNGGPSDGDGNI
jgi:cytochrome c5